MFLTRKQRNIQKPSLFQLLKTLQTRFHRLRQSGIDEELFDVVAGFDALQA